MDGIKILKNRKIYISFVVVLVITVLFSPIRGRFNLHYQIGKPWVYETFIAPIDFPILKTDEELLEERREKASLVVKYYNFNDNIESIQSTKLAEAFTGTALSSEYLAGLYHHFASLYGRGIISEYANEVGDKGMIIIEKNKRAVQVPGKEVFDVEYALEFLKYRMSVDFPVVDNDSLFNAYRVQEYIVPNLIYDEKKTEQLNLQAVNYISPTKGMVYTGEIIVSEGEIVTAEVYQLLESYKQEFENSIGRSSHLGGLVLGRFIVFAMVLAMLFATIYFTNIWVFKGFNRYAFILLLFALVIFITTIVMESNVLILYMVPYSVFAMYLLAFYKNSFAFPMYVLILLPLLLISSDGMELYFMNLAAGTVLFVSQKHFSKGWLQFLNAIFIFIGLVVIYVAFRLLSNGTLSSFDPGILFYLGVNSFLVVFAYPLVFLFEKIFKFVSISTLKDLSDTNSKLLQQLSEVAPGSFQHSLQVANLAAAAVREIGGNDVLARVGALYHDIGKIKNPQCFVENQAPGINYHKGLTPMESAKQIIRHVDDGVELAKKANLPEVVIEFIRTHHAKSQTLYFYNVYCNNGGNPEEKEPFTYHGNYPHTKEQVVVLMADAVEAASRSLQEYTEESISALVEKIIAARLAEDQLVEAEISIKEINTVKEMFKAQLMQMYHARIAYPERNK
ncbi:MAG: HDIG domain-containing protein [Bacteroidales bacterium]|nr:HDIG domain-containing protein [Bacteroidales bacterium]